MPAFRDILVAVVGLTPQVITETVYYLTQVHRPPVALAAIHVLTTQPGKVQLRRQLLAPQGGHFHTFCAEYGLDPRTIAFEVHVLRDTASAPLEDIRTAADSIAVADQIAALIQQLTRDPATRLFCSLAGGRKTQSVLLGFALQLYGRSQDRLLHVLVDEEFQNHPDFFYPSKESRLLSTRDGRHVDTHTARIDVADIPFLRMREKLFTPTASGDLGFAPAMVQAQQKLDTLLDLPPLRLSHTARSMTIGETVIPLTPLEFVLYARLAQIRCQQAQAHPGDGFVTLDELEAMQGELLQHYASLYGTHAARVKSLRQQWARGWSRDSIRSHFSAINHKIQQAIPEKAQAVFYRVESEGPYGKTRYGLRLPAGKIELRED
ncbi:MAG TPA: CRISPR-associated ring nuclease Csm6 [Candidatus Tectomicrobia bacterium]